GRGYWPWTANGKSPSARDTAGPAPGRGSRCAPAGRGGSTVPPPPPRGRRPGPPSSNEGGAMAELTKNQTLSAYRAMRTIREFEERVHKEFATGDIPGFVHLYAGEEASAAGVCLNLDERDTIASTHRGHGHCIAKGVDVGEMMAEIYGRRTGSCHGKG